MSNTKHDLSKAPANRLDQLFCLPMFCAAILFLLLTGAIVHLKEGHLLNTRLGNGCLIGLALLYPLFVLETVVHYVAGSRNMRQHFWYLLMPIFRLCGRDHINGTHVWLPLLGWQKTDRSLEKLLARRFSIPMIIIALLVLPVVILELFWAELIVDSPRLTFALETATVWIWMAFVFEFVVMISVVDHKLAYCRKNWIDLAIVLLPLVSFMRAARLGTAMQVKQLSRTARVYRVRGVALRTWRAFVTLDVLDMILRRDPSYRMEKLAEEIAEKADELDYLKSELIRLKLRYPDAVPEEDPAVVNEFASAGVKFQSVKTPVLDLAQVETSAAKANATA